MDTLLPAEAGRRPSIPPPADCAPPRLENRAAARAWLEPSGPIWSPWPCTLPRMAGPTMPHGWRYLVPLPRRRRHFAEAVIIHGHARSAAAQISDRNAEADALTSLSLVDLHRAATSRPPPTSGGPWR